MTSTSVDGLVSGLSTSSIIDQLMQIEASGQTALKTRVTEQQKAVTAYQSVNSKMTALLTASRDLTKVGGLDAMKVTSTSDAVSGTAAYSAAAGSFAFTVKQTALADTKLSNPYASLTAQGASGASFSITSGGTSKTLTPASNTLQGVVDAINSDSSIGVRAAAIAMGDGTYRLQMAATKTGSAGTFSVSGLAQPVTQTQLGQDAKITLAGSTVDVSSSSNTFTNVLPGLTFSVKPGTTSGTAVTLEVGRDTDKVSESMQKMVDAANAALTEIAAQTKYDQATKKGQPLVGDYGVRQLAQQILSAVSLSGGSTATAKNVGVELSRDGKLTFDKDTFVKALNETPDVVKKVLGMNGASSAPAVAGFVSGTDRTQPGTYTAQVTSQPTKANGSATYVKNTDFWFRMNGVTIQGNEKDGNTLAGTLNGLATAKGLGVTFGGTGRRHLDAHHREHGCRRGPGLRVGGRHSRNPSRGLEQRLRHRRDRADRQRRRIELVRDDVSGTTMSVSDLNSPASGLAVSMGATGTAQLTVNAGLAQRLGNIAISATDSANGRLTTAINGRQSQITDLNKQIDSWDVRLALRKESLQKTYGNLETALGKLKSQSSWLASQIASLG